MEQEHELDADVVRVLHVCPHANRGVHETMNRPSHTSAGTDALDIWAKICRQPDRFIRIDSDRFATARLRSGDYVDRYTIPGHPQSAGWAMNIRAS